MCRDTCIADFNASRGQWDLSASHLRGLRNRSERLGGPVDRRSSPQNAALRMNVSNAKAASRRWAPWPMAG